MYRTQCVLVLAALYVGLAHSWDIAVSLGDQLIFYTDGRQSNTLNFFSHNLTKLVYDELHNRMLYVDKQSLNDGICGYNFLSMENKCFIRRVGGNIHDIAFDPATETVFFTDTNERSINSISLKPESNNNINLVIKMDDRRTPSDIAVDSCRGYIYWTNKNVIREEYMERARLNGSDREVIQQFQDIITFAADLQSRKIYILYNSANTYDSTILMESMESQDLVHPNHQNINTLSRAGSDLSEQKELTVSNDYLYWLSSSNGYSAVWQLQKNKTFGEKAQLSSFNLKSLHGIAANYKMKDQIEGLQDCEVLSLKPRITGTNSSLNIQQTTGTEHTTESSTAAELLCVHGIKVSETCKCIPGYIGERCDVSACENYCLQGDCSFNDEGLPKCRCNAGHSGTRCEVYACHGYCLNNGVCSLNEEDEPVCQCVGDHEGIRCEVVNDKIPSYDSAKTNLIYKPYIYISSNNTILYPMPYTNTNSLELGERR